MKKSIFSAAFYCNLWGFLIFCFLLPHTVQGAENSDLEEDYETEDFLETEAKEDVQIDKDTSLNILSEFLSQNITGATALPIKKAEKVFCYLVDYAEKGFEGYMLNGLAIKGYCGELSKDGQVLVSSSLLNNSLAFSKSKTECRIAPKIVLRYVYGVDYTDVLLSSPCPSLTFFHGRDITSINATPGGAIIDQIINAYSSLREDFNSPAMLDQMVGSGVPQTQLQKEFVRRNAPNDASLKKWNTEQPKTQNNTNNAAQQPAKSGWNKLK